MKLNCKRVWLERQTSDIKELLEEEDVNEEGGVSIQSETLTLRLANISFLLSEVKGWEEVVEPFASMYRNLGIKNVVQVDLFQDEPRIINMSPEKFDEIWDEYLRNSKMGIHD